MVAFTKTKSPVKEQEILVIEKLTESLSKEEGAPEFVKLSEVNDIGFKYGCPNANFLPLIFFFPGTGEREGLFICFRKSQNAL